MTNYFPGTGKHPWRRVVDPSYFADTPRATGATAAVAPNNGTWTPAGSAPVNTLTEMVGITATPNTAWTAGQRVQLGDGSLAHWNGGAWFAGAKP